VVRAAPCSRRCEISLYSFSLDKDTHLGPETSRQTNGN
jgi:hypothetical protein